MGLWHTELGMAGTAGIAVTMTVAMTTAVVMVVMDMARAMGGRAIGEMTSCGANLKFH